MLLQDLEESVVLVWRIGIIEKGVYRHWRLLAYLYVYMAAMPGSCSRWLLGSLEGSFLVAWKNVLVDRVDTIIKNGSKFGNILRLLLYYSSIATSSCCLIRVSCIYTVVHPQEGWIFLYATATADLWKSCDNDTSVSE